MGSSCESSEGQNAERIVVSKGQAQEVLDGEGLYWKLDLGLFVLHSGKKLAYILPMS